MSTAAKAGEPGANKVTTKNLLKFILGSLFGVSMFLIPIPKNGTFTTLNNELTSLIEAALGSALSYLVLFVVAVSVVMPLIDFITKPRWIRENFIFSKVFVTNKIYFTLRVLGLIATTMVVFGVGPEFVISGATGGTMVGMVGTLFAITIPLGFIMPFLTDCGIMEFLGIILKKVTRPLFCVPGRASIDLVTSWFGASNAAAILTREQYNKGFYTKREAGIIMTNFSVVSIPFCMVIASAVDVAHLFPAFYASICLVGIVLAVILPRIPPLRTQPATYNEETGKQINEEVPAHKSLFRWAVEMSCDRADSFGPKNVVRGGLQVTTGLFFDLIPIVLSCGTLGLILAEYTPIFTWISYPMGLFLSLFGLPDAFAAAPATLVGFIDMYIPAILLGKDLELRTRFIVGVLSLIQIIYMTEVGIIMMKAKIKIGLGKLFILFMERTLIGIPLIVLCAWIFGVR